jgi:hypothetical protein
MQQGTWHRGFTAVMLMAMGLGWAVPSWARALEAPIFVLNSLDATVSVIDPYQLQLSPDMRWFDVASKTVVRQIKVGRSPHGVWTLDHVARR